MNAKHFMPTAIALGLLYTLLLALPAQAESYQGHTCKDLRKHVRAGGDIIGEDVRNWFGSQCKGKKGANDNKKDAEDREENVNGPDFLKVQIPPPSSCNHLPPRVAVAGFANNTQCQVVGPAAIGQHELTERGFIDAVDVWAYVPNSVEVCFRDEGWLAFLDAAYAPRMPMELKSYVRDGMTCGTIDRAGTVVLLESAAPAEETTVSVAAGTLPTFESVALVDCQIKLVETLFLRAEPAGEIIGLVWLYSEVPAFEINGYWYKIEFEGVTGYISRFHRKVLWGNCG